MARLLHMLGAGGIVTMARTRKRTVRIPKRSVLKRFERRGVQGTCQECGQQIANHFDGRSKWLGCKAQTVAPDVPLILIRDRRQERRYSSMSGPQGRDQAAQAPQAGSKHRNAVAADMGVLRGRGEDRHIIAPMPPTRVAYIAKFGMRDSRVTSLESVRDLGIYRLIHQAAKKGVTRGGLLAALKTTHTGIVDGAVRRLWIAGLIDKQVITPA